MRRRLPGQVLSRGPWSVAVVALMAVWLGACQGAEEAGSSASAAPVEISVRLPIPVVDVAFSPYYLAQDEGYFADEGLSVTIEPGSAELNPVRMVEAGVDEFAVLGGPELLMSARANGAGLVGIALIHADANFPVILSLAESGIDTPAALNGKRIGFFLAHISTDVLRAFLSQESVDYTEVDIGFNYSTLLSGQVDASWAFRTTAGITLPAQGVELNVIDPGDYGITSQGHLVVTHERTIAESPDLVRAFLRAVAAGAQHGIDHPGDAVASAMRRDTNFTEQIGNAQIAIYNETIQRNRVFGWMDADMLGGVAVLDGGFDPTGGFRNDFLPQLPKSIGNDD